MNPGFATEPVLHRIVQALRLVSFWRATCTFYPSGITVLLFSAGSNPTRSVRETTIQTTALDVGRVDETITHPAARCRQGPDSGHRPLGWRRGKIVLHSLSGAYTICPYTNFDRNRGADHVTLKFKPSYVISEILRADLIFIICVIKAYNGPLCKC